MPDLAACAGPLNPGAMAAGCGHRPPHGAPWPDVSVCIVHRDGETLLRGCLASLLHQPQGARLEVIVVDNGSTDGSAEMAAQAFPQVALVRNAANAGFSRANNQAAARARGRYLFFLNNDTLVPAGSIGRLLAFAEAHPEVGLVGPRLRDGAGRIQVSCRPRLSFLTLLHRMTGLRRLGLLRALYRRQRREGFDPNRTRPVGVLMGAALLMRRDAFQAVGGWDEDFVFGGEDMELCDRVGRSALVVYHPDVEITHFGRASTRRHIGPASSAIAFGFARYLRKSGAGPLRLAVFKLAVTLDAPLQVAVKALEYLLRRLRGSSKAAKSALALRAAVYFLTRGLPLFWRA